MMVHWWIFIACMCTMVMRSSHGEQDQNAILISSGLAADMEALLAIKSSLHQKPIPPNSSLTLGDWVLSNLSSPCSWSRVTCNPSPWFANQTRVTSLDLSSLSISGSFPSGFSKLLALSHLNLSHNSISGPLSEDNIANCTRLLSLDLSFNNLSALFAPSSRADRAKDDQSLENLINLQFLYLGSNHISSLNVSSLPLPHLCGQLRHLDLSSNSVDLDLGQAFPWHLCSSLQTLDLSYNSYTGSIPSGLASLPSLKVLHANNNQLTGTIPTSICSSNSSSSLRKINLSANNLTGAFPLSLLRCVSLQQLAISINQITGDIPPQVGKMVSLKNLKIAENKLTGSLPAELGGLTKLKKFIAGSNSFIGSIPPQLKNCTKLQLIALDSNRLQGPVPGFLGDMVSLWYISLHDNAFSGTIPLALFNPQSTIKLLDVSRNNLSGTIPTQFANLAHLKYLMLAENKLTGAIPSEIGSISALQILDVSSNHLSDRIPPSLGQLQHLLWLNLAFNNLTGSIPAQLGNCTSLLWLNLKSNALSGLLPPDLASMGSDPSETFRSNVEERHYGPKTRGMCAMIKRWVPEDFPPYSFVYDVIKDKNACKSYWLVFLTKSPFDKVCTSGQAGGDFSKGYIQLSYNKLTGPILYNLQANRTTFLLLSFNSFNGSLPGGLSKLPLLAINASHNMLDGNIPESLADDNRCLTFLDLSYNNLSGSIPAALASFNQLSELNLSYNPFLSGPIPISGQFSTFTIDSYLNDSHLCLQDMSGMRPHDNISAHLPFCDDSGPQSDPQEGAGEAHGEQSKRRKSADLFIAGLLGSLFILFCGALALYVLWMWVNHRRVTSSTSYGNHDDASKEDHSKSTVYFFKESDSHAGSESSVARAPLIFTYADLLLATNNFSDEHVIGRGGFGTVYKAKLRDGSMVAIKKLIIERGPSEHEQGEREFMAEMETLGTITHENLVPLLACCSCGSEKLVVYKLMSNGSLEDWLHIKERRRYGAGAGEMSRKEGESRDGAEEEEDHLQGDGAAAAGGESLLQEGELSWDARVKIARGCANALSFLHQECMIIHRDVKASNVLLDEDFNAYVTDFGLARELPPGVSHVSTVLAGTLGYVAPEYCHTWRATTKGDVYSFGVVLLELLTGQQPATCAACDGSLLDWVRLLVSQSRPAEAWHPVVRRTAAGRYHQVLAFMRLALACASDRPEQRPSMQEVALTLQNIL